MRSITDATHRCTMPPVSVRPRSSRCCWRPVLNRTCVTLSRTRRCTRLRPGAAARLPVHGSVAGHVAYEGGAAYCGAKAAELKITQALRLELSGTGVRVGTIDPGMAETEFSVVRFKGDAERAKKVYEGVVPLSSEDIAETLVWAASRPPHVCIDEMLIKCTDQAAIHKVHRRTQGR